MIYEYFNDLIFCVLFYGYQKKSPHENHFVDYTSPNDR
jgi:hypothetical protein